MSLIASMAMIFISFGSYANDEVYREAVANIEKARAALKSGFSLSAACEVGQVAACSFTDYCSNFDSKSQDVVLYKNDDGRIIPNVQLLNVMKAAEACLYRPFEDAMLADPFLVPQSFTKEQLAQFQIRAQQLQGTFSDAQNAIVRVLEKRKTSSTAAEYDKLIQRIKSVKMETIDADTARNGLVAQGCEGPNAIYFPDKHQVRICPQLLNMPEATLFSLISHELGHSIDPCSAGENLAIDSSGNISNRPLQGGRLFVERIASSRNPFSNVISCLQKPGSMEVKVPSKSDMLSHIAKTEKSVREYNGELTPETEKLFDSAKNLVNKNYEEIKYCGNVGDIKYNIHMQEAFSDWISSQALAEKLQGMTDSRGAKQFAFESQGLWAADCARIGRPAFHRVRDMVIKQCPEFAKLESYFIENPSPDQHPKTSDRTNKIQYVTPEMQKALGCKPQDRFKACN